MQRGTPPTGKAATGPDGFHASTQPPRVNAPVFIWLVLFELSWCAFVYAGDHWDTVVTHWPIALAMALGSYFAGSTPMGGGTIGFPVLVLLFDQPASLGRNFGLAVQSVGMVSASIYILCARRPLDWHLLKLAIAGALVGTAIGFVGGIVASMTGVGIDMIIYAVLLLLYRADLKIAIPTSVVLMAFTSVVGIVSNLLLAAAFPLSYEVVPAVFDNWLAAAPIVAVGAPFGAFVISRLPRTPTLLIVSVLCLLQFVWTLVKEQVTGWELVLALGGVLAMNMVFHALFRCGERRRNTVS